MDGKVYMECSTFSPTHPDQYVGEMKNKLLTLVLLRDMQKGILLGLKKRGFGVGKWNGFGGKVKEGETIAECAIRETEEECGLKVKECHLRKLGRILFEFEDDPPLLEVHLFTCWTFEGVISESEEMKPQWFALNQIPFQKMWKDDKIWFPTMLKDEPFQAYFKFQGHEKIVDSRLSKTGEVWPCFQE